MELYLENHTDWQQKAEIFEWVISRIPQILPDVHFESVELLLTDDKAIQELNRQYRQKDKPTDVLSFPMGEQLLGQIIISVPTAQSQADQIGQSLEDELQFLFTHGVLHCLGYDHQNPEEEAVMLGKTYEILQRKNPAHAVDKSS